MKTLVTLSYYREKALKMEEKKIISLTSRWEWAEDRGQYTPTRTLGLSIELACFPLEM